VDPSDLSELSEVGLYDPDSPDADDRRALLEYLLAHGATIERMLTAAAEQRLPAVAGDLRIEGGGPRLGLDELAARAGLSRDLAARVWRASGFPEPDPGSRPFTEADVETFAAFAGAARLFGEAPILDFTRVVSSAMARVAEAGVALFLADVEQPLSERDAGELALARANVAAVESLETLPHVMESLFRHHIVTAIDRLARGGDRQADLDTTYLAVGFVDLVGFTPLVQHLDARELARTVTEFEGRAHDLVAGREGRVVKFIGDEVMFVARDPAAACDVALALVDTFRDHGTVTPRGAVGWGPLLARGGDYYGPVVNLASRAAELAVRDEILVTPEVRDVVGSDDGALRFEPAGRRMLKGFEDPVLLLSVSRGRSRPEPVTPARRTR